MRNRWIAFLLAVTLVCSLSGCKREAVTKEQEESAGTGYGVTQKSALILQDLYFLRPGTARSAVATALGSPGSYALAESSTDTYRLTGGETLVLTYNENDKITEAVYTDTAGKKQDFFSYLKELGILTSYQSSGGATEQEPPAEEEPVQKPENEPIINADSGYFSTKRYSYEMAEQLLKEGVERETVVSALGKPNSYSSVTFQADSYIIDVYVMEDGSSLLLDYGYNRTSLRAVQQVKGTFSTTYLGTWGQEEKPNGFYRYTRNQTVFNTLKKNAKPSEIYRRFGEPDWLEGSADHYRDAYLLLNGGVFYLDFGADHSGLTAAVLKKSDGTIVNYTLR